MIDSNPVIPQYSGITCIILCLLLAAGCSKPQWKEYSYPDAGFVVSSPTPPRIQKPNSIMTEYLMELPHHAMFSVMYVDLEKPPINDASAKANMDKLAGYIAKGTPGKVISMQDVVFADKPGKSFVISNGPLTVHGRCYQSGSRMYALISRGSPPSRDTDRFLDSFRVF